MHGRGRPRTGPTQGVLSASGTRIVTRRSLKEQNAINATFTRALRAIIVERASSRHALQYHWHLQSCTRSRAVRSLRLRCSTVPAQRAPEKRPRLFRDHHYRPRQCNQRPGYHHYGRVCLSCAHGSRGRGCRGSRGLDQHTARKQYAAAHSALCQPCDASRPSASALVMSGTVTASGRVCSGIIYLSAGEQRQPGASSTCVQFRPLTFPVRALSFML